MLFNRYIGIDYSGAQSPQSRLKALQVYSAGRDGEPERVFPPVAGTKNWTRQEIAQFCAEAIESDQNAIIGIDHGFSFPHTYLRRNFIDSWDQFLDDFMRHWPTAWACGRLNGSWKICHFASCNLNNTKPLPKNWPKNAKIGNSSFNPVHNI